MIIFMVGVTSGAKNTARSVQNKNDLETLGFKESEGGREKTFEKYLEEGLFAPQTRVLKEGIRESLL